MDRSSRFKPIVDRRQVNTLDVPILETGDLPADDDWALTKSLEIGPDDVDDGNFDSRRITISSDDFE